MKNKSEMFEKITYIFYFLTAFFIIIDLFIKSKVLKCLSEYSLGLYGNEPSYAKCGLNFMAAALSLSFFYIILVLAFLSFVNTVVAELRYKLKISKTGLFLLLSFFSYYLYMHEIIPNWENEFI